MKKFEYIVKRLASSMSSGMLNLYGSEGWELVSVYISINKYTVYTFKREKIC